MNRQQIEATWEACRDGSLSEADRAAFEQYLRGNETARAMWNAETQWLKLLADPAQDEDATEAVKPGSERTTFVASVLDHWQAEAEREELAVVAVIGPRSTASRRYVAWAVGIAAMVALFLLGNVFSKLLNPPPGPAVPNASVAVIPPTVDPVSPPAPDGIGMLMASAKDSYALAAAQPARIKEGFTSTAAFLDVSRLASFLDADVPDPAQFVEPKIGG